MLALHNGRLVTAAHHVIQPDVAFPLPEKGRSFGGQSRSALQFPADHPGVGQGPAVVAHRPPLAAVEDLHATRAARRPRQPDLLAAWTRNESKEEQWWRRSDTELLPGSAGAPHLPATPSSRDLRQRQSVFRTLMFVPFLWCVTVSFHGSRNARWSRFSSGKLSEGSYTQEVVI